jgi:hypothetical protein
MHAYIMPNLLNQLIVVLCKLGRFDKVLILVALRLLETSFQYSYPTIRCPII